MAAEAQIKAVITADDRASKTIGGFGTKLGDLSVGAVAAGAAIFGLGKAAVGFGVASVKAFSESENQVSQLNAVLKSTGNAAGVTADEAINLSKALQKSTAFSDEQILSAENMLLTFTALKKDAFPQATKTALDMATALNHGLTPSTEEAADTMKLLGKALQDPDAGLGALHRVGVNVEELKKKFVGVNDIATKQRLILAELNTEYGGSAEAAGKTFAGSLKRLENSFNDLQEQIGQTIANGLAPFINEIATFIASPGFQKWLQDAINKFAQFVTGLSEFVKNIWPLVKDAFTVMGIVLQTTVVPAFTIMAGAMKSLGENSDAIHNKLSGIAEYLVNTFSPAWQEIAQFWNETFIPNMKMLADYFEFVVKPKLKEFADMLDKAGINGKLLAQIFGGAVIIAIVILAGALIAIVGFIQVVAEAFIWVGKKADEFGYNLVTTINASLQGYRNMAAGAEQMGYDIYNTLTAIIRWFQSSFNSIRSFVGNSLNEITSWFRSLPDSIANGLGNLFEKITKPFRDAFNWVKDQAGKVKDAVANALDPTKKHSPSLVDKVKSGTQVIKDEYSSLFDNIKALPSDFRVADLAQPMPTQQIQQPGLLPAQQSTSNINITISTMYSSGSEQEKRTFAKEILTALKDVANQKNTSVSELMGV